MEIYRKRADVKGWIYEQMAKNSMVQHNFSTRVFYGLFDINSYNEIQQNCHSSDSFVFSDYSFLDFGGNIKNNFWQKIRAS